MKEDMSLCKKLGRKFGKKCWSFKKLLQKCHVIDTLCYIPLNMSIMLLLFHDINRLKDDHTLPDTQIELIYQDVMMTMQHNLV